MVAASTLDMIAAIKAAMMIPRMPIGISSNASLGKGKVGRGEIGVELKRDDPGRDHDEDVGSFRKPANSAPIWPFFQVFAASVRCATNWFIVQSRS